MGFPSLHTSFFSIHISGQLVDRCCFQIDYFDKSLLGFYSTADKIVSNWDKLCFKRARRAFLEFPTLVSCETRPIKGEKVWSTRSLNYVLSIVYSLVPYVRYCFKPFSPFPVPFHCPLPHPATKIPWESEPALHLALLIGKQTTFKRSIGFQN